MKRDLRSPRSVGDLVPHAKNARKHDERNQDTIVASLREVGAARSIVIDEKGVILAGNATAAAALKAGVLKLHVVDADGQTLVAVRRSGLTDAKKHTLALADNRAAEHATWDAEILRELHEQGIRLDDLWTVDELVDLFGGAVNPGLTSPDAVPPERPTSIVVGQAFALGAHRLVCGDCTDPGFVRAALDGSKPRLMVTDPPYGVNYDPGWRREAGVTTSARMGKVENDDRADWREAWRLFPGDVCYVWHAGLFASVVEESLASCTFELRSQIIWRKARIVLSRGHYHWQHEPAWFAVRKGLDRGVSVDGAARLTLMQRAGDRPDGRLVPLAAPMRGPVRNHKAPIVYEPFSGSGTSIIAAEMLGRSCRALELSPGYCQQAIDRWEAFTGKKAVKVSDAHAAKT